MLVVDTKQRGGRKRTHAMHPPEGHIRVESNIQQSPYFRSKETIERLLAAVLLIPGIPLIGLLIILVRLQSRGPGLYRQIRLGKNGHVFTMYKIRTMRQDAEAKTGAVWAKTNDSRTTLLGRVLRKLHLDELPQLFNVVKREMALIGPRPERPEIAAMLVESIPHYMDRLVVLPGVTGLAQINLPPDSTLDDVRRKLVVDVDYIKRAGPWLDARIFMSTFVRLLGLPGAAAMTLFGLHRRPDVHNGDRHAMTPPSESHAALAKTGGRVEGSSSHDGAKKHSAESPRKPR
jgi:lipopolysaccharide/colanic/teichoic acid biosynthesis glycosyltransferase